MGSSPNYGPFLSPNIVWHPSKKDPPKQTTPDDLEIPALRELFVASRNVRARRIQRETT